MVRDITKQILEAKYKIAVISIEIITLLSILFLSYNHLFTPKGKTTFYLPHSSIASLKTTLKSNGYTIYMLDKLLLPFIDTPKKGWYTIDKNQGRFFFFTNLYQMKTPPSKIISIKIFAGETSMELCNRLANDMDLNSTTLLDIYQQKSLYTEGDIFEGRYKLPKKIDEETVLSYLFFSSQKLFQNFERTIAKKPLRLSEKKILLNIASIIQKESNAKEEMPIISSVIYNRLQKNMRLQMDGTLNYGKYAHTIVTSERIKEDKSFYNTYKHKGLPPAPLSTVSIDALKAAYHPKQGKYLFFMLTKNGTHTFAENYQNHLKNVHKFKKEMKKEKYLKEHNTTLKKSTIQEQNTTSLHTLNDTNRKRDKSNKTDSKKNLKSTSK